MKREHCVTTNTATMCAPPPTLSISLFFSLSLSLSVSLALVSEGRQRLGHPEWRPALLPTPKPPRTTRSTPVKEERREGSHSSGFLRFKKLPRSDQIVGNRNRPVRLFPKVCSPKVKFDPIAFLGRFPITTRLLTFYVRSKQTGAKEILSAPVQIRQA